MHAQLLYATYARRIYARHAFITHALYGFPSVSIIKLLLVPNAAIRAITGKYDCINPILLCYMIVQSYYHHYLSV